MMICSICGASLAAGRLHRGWHASQDLQIDLLRSIVEAQLKRIQKLENPPPRWAWVDNTGQAWECNEYDHGPFCRGCRQVASPTPSES